MSIYIDIVELLRVAIPVSAVLVALLAYFLARWNNSKTLSAKYRDRLYEINKMGVQYGDVYHEYLKNKNRYLPYFTSLENSLFCREKASRELESRVKSYIFFRLNFYEEIFFAINSWNVVLEDKKAWKKYIRSELKHALVFEILTLEKERFSEAFYNFAKSSAEERKDDDNKKRTNKDTHNSPAES